MIIRKDIPHWKKQCPMCDGSGDAEEGKDGPYDEDCPQCKGAGIVEKGHISPMNYAWVILKNGIESWCSVCEGDGQIDAPSVGEDFLPCPKCNPEGKMRTDRERSSLGMTMNLPDFDDYQLNDRGYPIQEEDDTFEWPSTEIKPRKENPVNIDAFSMQKPAMQEALNHIAAELARRGGFMQKPSSPPDKNNPMVQHTRAEMLAAQKQIEDEQARRKAKREARRNE